MLTLTLENAGQNVVVLAVSRAATNALSTCKPGLNCVPDFWADDGELRADVRQGAAAPNHLPLETCRELGSGTVSDALGPVDILAQTRNAGVFVIG